MPSLKTVRNTPRHARIVPSSRGGGIGREDFDSFGSRKRPGPLRRIARTLKKASRKFRRSLFGDDMRKENEVREKVIQHNKLIKGDKGPTMKAANVFWPPTQNNTPTKFFVMVDRDAHGRKLNEPQLVHAQRWIQEPDESPVWEPHLHFGTDRYGRDADGWIQAAGRRKR